MINQNQSKFFSSPNNPSSTGQQKMATDEEAALPFCRNHEELKLRFEQLGSKNDTPFLSDTLISALKQLHNKQFSLLAGDELEKAIMVFCTRYNIPLGLISDLIRLSEYNIHFIIDNSNSMTQPAIKPSTVATALSNIDSTSWTRWHEVQNKLYIFMEVLTLLPIENIKLSFLNSPKIFTYSPKNQDNLIAGGNNAYNFIHSVFAKVQPKDDCHLNISGLLHEINKPSQKTAYYVLTDNEPLNSQAPVLFTNRFNPHSQHVTTFSVIEGYDFLCRDDPYNKPVTFIGVTTKNKMNWICEIPEIGPCAEGFKSDFAIYKKELLDTQGPSLPFNEGIWLALQLLTSTSTVLMKLTDGFKLEKSSMDTYFGTISTPEEYSKYCNHYSRLGSASEEIDEQAHRVYMFARRGIETDSPEIQTKNLLLNRPV